MFSALHRKVLLSLVPAMGRLRADPPRKARRNRTSSARCRSQIQFLYCHRCPSAARVRNCQQSEPRLRIVAAARQFKEGAPIFERSWRCVAWRFAQSAAASVLGLLRLTCEPRSPNRFFGAVFDFTAHFRRIGSHLDTGREALPGARKHNWLPSALR